MVLWEQFQTLKYWFCHVALPPWKNELTSPNPLSSKNRHKSNFLK